MFGRKGVNQFTLAQFRCSRCGAGCPPRADSRVDPTRFRVRASQAAAPRPPALVPWARAGRPAASHPRTLAAINSGAGRHPISPQPKKAQAEPRLRSFASTSRRGGSRPRPAASRLPSPLQPLFRASAPQEHRWRPPPLRKPLGRSFQEACCWSRLCAAAGRIPTNVSSSFLLVLCSRHRSPLCAPGLGSEGRRLFIV